MVNGSGGTSLPTTNTTSAETALDVQWAHVIAPQANILLAAALRRSFSATDAAVNYAKSVPGVSVISMSYGAADFSGETTYDSTFTQPSGHAGVSFVASSGDSSSPSYPAASPHVIGVGGTNLTVNTNGTRNAETVWNNGVSTSATGTGLCVGETEPAFQQGVQSSGQRSVPDVHRRRPQLRRLRRLRASNTLYSNVGGTSIGAPSGPASSPLPTRAASSTASPPSPAIRP